jgi:penicillin-binding protein 1A
MLQSAVEAGTGKRAGLQSHAAAGKTGTSQDFRDAWFVGYTAHFTGGVWMGNDGGEPMRKATGGHLPALIWNRVMEHAHEGRESLPLAGTEALAQVPAGRGDRPPPELLPWQMPATAAPRGRKPNSAPPERRAEGTSYPSTPIGDDFIARALADIPKEGPQLAEREDVRAAGSPNRQPLPGMMSLGVGMAAGR